MVDQGVLKRVIVLVVLTVVLLAVLNGLMPVFSTSIYTFISGGNITVAQKASLVTITSAIMNVIYIIAVIGVTIGMIYLFLPMITGKKN